DASLRAERCPQLRSARRLASRRHGSGTRWKPSPSSPPPASRSPGRCTSWPATRRFSNADRKSTRLNSSHRTNSYAAFCLKKKTQHLDDSRLLRQNTDVALRYATFFELQFVHTDALIQ